MFLSILQVNPYNPYLAVGWGEGKILKYAKKCFIHLLLLCAFSHARTISQSLFESLLKQKVKDGVGLFGHPVLEFELPF